jgi:DNA polymerase-3 subunit epsilon
MRQVILDTETTGLDPAQGHRIIEIGCVEMVNRRLTGDSYQQYIMPEREIDPGAIEVHGITNEFLADKPFFANVASDFIEYIKGAELIIHNAPFDTGFLNNEFKLLSKNKPETIEKHCSVIDTLRMARKMHPGQRNDLDSLCRRYGIDNTQRTLHGALLDAEILADVYLAMTGGQTGLFDDGVKGSGDMTDLSAQIRRVDENRPSLPVISASTEEQAAHEKWIAELDESVEGQCLWSRLDLK